MTLTETFEPLVLRRVFGTFPTGVAALAAVVGEAPHGIAVSSFTSVSLEPAMVLVCVAHPSTTWPTLSKAPRLGISVLAADQEQACRQLGAKDGDRFAGLEWHATDDGAVLLDGASAWLECSVEQQNRAGDHDIVVLRVHGLDGDHSVSPLVFHGSRLRRLYPEPVAGNDGHPGHQGQQR
jgi:flavin reductase (DIM6/NTAB) family NADH-FMN oxidoreductase RutF